MFLSPTVSNTKIRKLFLKIVLIFQTENVVITGPFKIMFRMVKFAKADQVWNVSVDLYGNDRVCSPRTRVFVETEERTDTLTSGQFLQCQRNGTVNQLENLKVCSYDCACIVDCKYLQLTVDNSVTGPELCEVVMSDTTPQI